MERSRSIQIGVVVQKRQSIHRWGGIIWMPIGILPGAGPAQWKVLRAADGVVDYHAATVPLELFRGETEAYRLALSKDPPLVWVVLRRNVEPGAPAVEVHHVTASPYEAQDYLDTGEEIVEPVAMPPALAEWVREFSDAHHHEEEFRKRRRDRVDVGRVDQGRGDPRIRQAGDVYRAPGLLRAGPREDRGDGS